ncbi:MAG: 16S rRNA (cytidine(1402)-2'-O)-methyltransferase, partial [Deinococcus sp.]
RFEETRRGSLRLLAEHFEAGVRGEIVVVVGGAPEAPAARPADQLERARTLAAEGRNVRELRDLLQGEGLRKNDAYELALRAVREQG